jgi:N6-adenosine-specific RNA methylase IME4
MDEIKKKYQIIYADPCWQYKDKSKSHGGGAESHYPCMSIKELCALNVSSIAEDNSVLLMWVTMPMLEVGFEVIKAWGFKYKTCAFTWVKTNKDNSIYMGMGRHTRANAEICLLATRGKGVAREHCDVKNTHLFPRTKHSEKPDAFRAMIEYLYGDKSRIELFARNKKERWSAWGNEVESDITLITELVEELK